MQELCSRFNRRLSPTAIDASIPGCGRLARRGKGGLRGPRRATPDEGHTAAARNQPILPFGNQVTLGVDDLCLFIPESVDVTGYKRKRPARFRLLGA